mmetsp:Transcript_74200/g.118177  ORF Transcript_74200/g.118177 Transcript_74200/m.118177 type:complete len:127 (-) Transcript_74200:836-1216(-)
MSVSVPDDYVCNSRTGMYAVNPPISAFWIGCLCYAIFGVVASILSCIVYRNNPLNRSVAVHSSIITAVCLWIMWACTWLSQWHPIAYPQYLPETYNDDSFNGSYTSCNETHDIAEIFWIGTGDTTQ